MGMTINEAIGMLRTAQIMLINPTTQEPISDLYYAYKMIIDLAKKYQMMQADYNARLKADMVAMLTDIQLEFEENTVRWYVGRVDGKSDDVVLMETINDIIQQKINTLRGAEHEQKVSHRKVRDKE